MGKPDDAWESGHLACIHVPPAKMALESSSISKRQRLKLSVESTSPASTAGQDDDDHTRRQPYYHENFKIILDDVLSGVDREIFVKSETDLVQGFLSLSSNALT